MNARSTTSLFRTRATVIWAAFVAATVASWWLGTHASSGEAASVGVLGIGCGKALFVGLDFMELRHAPRWLQATFVGWLLAVFVVLSALLIAG